MRIFRIRKPKQIIAPKPRPTGKDRKGELAVWMKNNPTPAESAMAKILKRSCITFESQVLMLGYIADFYIKSAKLIVEVDGEIHASQKSYDRNRDAIFREKGYSVLRVSNQKVLFKPDQVILDLRLAIDRARFAKREERYLRDKQKKKNAKRWQNVPKLTKSHLLRA